MVGFRDNGQRKYRSFYGQTQKEVRAKLRKFQEDEAAGLDTDKLWGFSEWADFWYEQHKCNIAPTTQENYKYTLRILKEHFTDRALRGIKPLDIEGFLKKQQREGASYSRLSQCRGMLYQIFHKAEANDLIRKNPVAFADKLRRRGPEQTRDAFTAEEVQTLFNELPENRIGWSIRLLLGTGMRTQELLALEPKHVAEDGSLIQIRQAINMDKGTARVGIPKSRDSYRDIPVPENVRYCARLLREQAGTYLWEGKPGQVINPKTFRSYFKKALEEVGSVRVLTPHCCRHTYVSQMQALGVDLATIQSIVGHADMNMTQHYLHVQEPIRQDAIERFAKAFSGTIPPDDPSSNCKIIPLSNLYIMHKGNSGQNSGREKLREVR
ncbi:MAG: site-specific integrase [Oscillospiraceae bacterium]|nr:site-specific integrase [Oscillospiraceae bacterium]